MKIPKIYQCIIIELRSKQFFFLRKWFIRWFETYHSSTIHCPPPPWWPLTSSTDFFLFIHFFCVIYADSIKQYRHCYAYIITYSWPNVLEIQYFFNISCIVDRKNNTKQMLLRIISLNFISPGKTVWKIWHFFSNIFVVIIIKFAYILDSNIGFW